MDILLPQTVTINFKRDSLFPRKSLLLFRQPAHLFRTPLRTTKNRFPRNGDKAVGKRRGKDWATRAPRLKDRGVDLPCPSAPQNKSFRKGDGGAGAGGKPFFKRGSPCPRKSLPLLSS